MGQEIVLEYLKAHPNKEYSAIELFINLKKDNKDISSFKAFTFNLRALKKHNKISSLPKVVQTFKKYDVLKMIYFYNDENGYQDLPLKHIENVKEEDYYKYIEK